MEEAPACGSLLALLAAQAAGGQTLALDREAARGVNRGGKGRRGMQVGGERPGDTALERCGACITSQQGRGSGGWAGGRV